MFNRESGRKVSKKPTLESYDNRAPMTEAQQASLGFARGAFTQDLVRDMPSTRSRDYALLVELGVNGEVPLAQAMVNAGLAANDNDKFAAVEAA